MDLRDEGARDFLEISRFGSLARGLQLTLFTKPPTQNRWLGKLGSVGLCRRPIESGGRGELGRRGPKFLSPVMNR